MKKEEITEKEILSDLKSRLLHEPSLPKAAHKRYEILAAITAIILLVITFGRPVPFFLVLGCTLLFIPLTLLFSWLLRRRRIERTTLDGYETEIAILSHKEKEEYQEWSYTVRGIRRCRTVTNYNLHFENGKLWRIPKDNYLWHGECPMSNFFIFENAHRGEEFLLVLNRETGEVAMAYSKAFFTYQKPRAAEEA
jgi:hypothetical protein